MLSPDSSEHGRPIVVSHAEVDGSSELARGLGGLLARGADGVVRALSVCHGSIDGARSADPPARIVPELRGATRLLGSYAIGCGFGTRGIRCTGTRSRPAPGSHQEFWTELRRATRAWAFVDQGCAVIEDREVRCVGHAGRLGEGSRPRTIAQIPADVAGMAFGQRELCWWRARGPISCAIDGTIEELPGPRDVASVAVSDTVSCAATRSGELWCWGRHPRGDGAPTHLAEPVVIERAR